LRAQGHEVAAFSRNGGQVGDVAVGKLDVLDAGAVEASARGVDGAFLCTGMVSRSKDDAEQLHRLHVLGTRSALAGLKAAGVRRMVLASTSGTMAVGTDPKRIFTEDDEAPLELIASWPYYRTKLFAEREALDTNEAGFEVVVVNPSLLLGPGDLRESSTGDVRRFMERGIPAVPSGGYAFVDARDAALGMLLAFERGKPGERYLLNGKNLTLNAFFQRLSRLTGIRAPWLKMPKNKELAMQMNEWFEKAVRAIGGQPPIDEDSVELAQYYWYCDSGKAERELGWVARDPGETLRDTVYDLMERGVVATTNATRLTPRMSTP
jgi:dihydroflavonol-4-reductase